MQRNAFHGACATPGAIVEGPTQGRSSDAIQDAQGIHPSHASLLPHGAASTLIPLLRLFPGQVYDALRSE